MALRINGGRQPAAQPHGVSALSMSGSDLRARRMQLYRITLITPYVRHTREGSLQSSFFITLHFLVM